jgi:hypothetical protein
MTNARTINYSKRDFASLKTEQINYIKQYYPGIVENYNDASILSVLLDLNAAIADNLHFNIDRSLQETTLDYAQERKSLFDIAKTYGLKIPSKASSVAICQFTIQVPVSGDAEDKRYLPILYAGSQFLADSNSFELLYDVDFSSNFNISNNVDRTKVPVYTNGTLSAYRITKTGIVVAGSTRVYSQSITNTKPFYQITLPENNVISIESVIHKNGTNFQVLPTISEFNSSTNKWYEVYSLAEDTIFINDTSVPPVNGIYSGSYNKVDRRFLREFTPNGFCILTFGSQTNQGIDILDDFVDAGSFDLKSFLNNNSLGWAPINNTTLYIKYRIGGGSDTNVGVGTINSVGQISTKISGPDARLNAIVQGSLSVTNITPAIGGGDAPSIEELRNYISYNFAAQNRAVTLQDYKAILLGMPAKFGSPSKVCVTQHQNKINVGVLSNDTDNNLTDTVSSVVLENIANYLSKFRMINDYVVVKPAEVIHIGFEVSALCESGSQISAVGSIISAINDEFLKEKMQIGQSYVMGNLIKKLTKLDGVININYIKVFNKVGGEYSSSTINPDRILNINTNEIDLSSGAIKVNGEQILQIKMPEKDIVVIPVTQNTFGF